MSRQTDVCPECDSARIENRVTENKFRESPKDYHCLECQMAFDNPATRTAESSKTGGSATVSMLEQMDVEVNYE